MRTEILSHDSFHVVPCFLCRGDWAEQLIGIGLIVSGVAVLQLFSKAAAH